MSTSKIVVGTIVLVCWAFELMENMAKHGEPKEGKYSFWVALIAKVIDFIILAIGGFWFFM